MQIEKDSRVVMPTGGSGGVSIVDALLSECDDVTSVTPVADDGGHSELVRSEVGTLPPGDATHQLAVHSRNPEKREFLTYRWEVEGARFGVRTGSEVLAQFEHLERSHSGGIKRMERFLQPNYLGRVIPISDDNFYILIQREDGTTIFGENSIDKMEFGGSPIKDIQFVNKNGEPLKPQVNPEAVEAASNSEFFVIPPGTLWGSHMQIAKVPNFAEAVQISRGPIVMVCNAVNTPETEGYTTSTFAEKFANVFGRPIDLVLADTPHYRLPKNYWPDDCTNFEEAGKRIFIQNDLKDGNEFARRVVEASLSRVEYIGNPTVGYKYVLRHDGLKTVNALQEALTSVR